MFERTDDRIICWSNVVEVLLLSVCTVYSGLASFYRNTDRYLKFCGRSARDYFSIRSVIQGLAREKTISGRKKMFKMSAKRDTIATAQLGISIS